MGVVEVVGMVTVAVCSYGLLELVAPGESAFSRRGVAALVLIAGLQAGAVLMEGAHKWHA
jgi:hypothetical protein